MNETMTQDAYREETAMSENAITRRSFLAGAAGATALVGCAGYMSFGAWQQAYAKPPEAADAEQVHTLCDGCGNKCGMVAWVRDGKVWRVSGETGHPCSRGHLCGRGQGLISSAYSEDRLTKPLKKNGSKFEEISWDQAFSEIGSALKTAGSKTAVLQARGNCTPFTKRFVQSLGSAHYYDESAVHDSDITAAIECVAGGYAAPDVENAKFALMLDKSTYDGMRPAELAAFAAKHEDSDSKVVLVDPRLTAFGRVADEWVPIVPGTELALLVGIASELINKGDYDEKFVKEHTTGFEEFTKTIRTYDLAWASEQTGIPDSTIAGLAAQLAKNAPASFVDMPWAGTFGAGYKNSFDTCRMVYLINAMLGNFNHKGGWIIGKTPYVSDDALEAAGIKKLATVSGKPAGNTASFAPTSCVAAIDAMKSGEISAAVVVESNPVLDYPGGDKVADALKSLSCLVVCDQFMTETAELANYVLPLDSYLESEGTPTTVGAETSVVAVRHAAVDRIHPDTKSIDEVICGLADACGKGDDFDFSLADYNKAWLKAAGLKEDLLDNQAFSAVAGSAVADGSFPYLRTKSGKVEFSSDAAKEAGLSAVPDWAEPQEPASKESPRLLIGEQNIQSATYTLAADKLTEISKNYKLDAAWINSDVAEKAGIAEGDNVKLTTSEGSITVPAHVTACICPEAVWVPAHYGSTAEKISEAKGFGAATKKLVPLASEPGTGAAMMNEASVSIVKAGA